MPEETIIAESTPPGVGGFSVLRLSGPSSLSFVTQVTKKAKDFFKPRKATLCPVYTKNKKEIDRCMITFFPAPNSYTGEDVIEAACHGNPIIVDALMSELFDHGARLAEPGEFTKRAFLNGKMDLVQAETVSALISSRTEKAVEILKRAASGELSTHLFSIRNKIVSSLSSCEYVLDISEQDLPKNFTSDLLKTTTYVTSKLEKLITNFKRSVYYFTGARVAITGKPNVGKSTLFNSIIGKSRAIVNETPGTTRDYIEATTVISGVPVMLIDTAGIRKTDDPVEMEGVRLSNEEVSSCDLVVNVYDSIDNIDLKRQGISVLNKNDITFYPKKLLVPGSLLSVSGKSGAGIPELKGAIIGSLIGDPTNTIDLSLTTKRQVRSISLARKAAKNATTLLGEIRPELELVAFELRSAVSQLDVVLGTTTTDDLLDAVFADFCIGK